MKKSQHYIWRNYLNPWTENGQIWCQRFNEPFKTSTMNIGQESYFYKAIPLNQDEMSFLSRFINTLHPTARKTVRDTLDVYLFSSVYDQKEGIEEYHTLIESRATELLRDLQNGDCDFFNNEKKRLDFSVYVGFQYSRTRKIRNKLIEMFEFPDMKSNIPKTVRPHILASAMSLITADNIGIWISSEAKISQLENNTAVPFITGDQPIINIKHDPNSWTPPEEIELYYPITPTSAILLSKEKKKDLVIKDSSQIAMLNKMIYDFSDNQIYAGDKESLRRTISSSEC